MPKPPYLQSPSSDSAAPRAAGQESLKNRRKKSADAVAPQDAYVRGLRENGALYRTLLNASRPSLVVTDRAGRPVLTHPPVPARKELSDPDRNRRPPANILGLCHPDGSACSIDDLPLVRAALDGETLESLDMALRDAEGALLPLRIVAFPVYDRRGSICGAAAIFQDGEKPLGGCEASNHRHQDLIEEISRHSEQMTHADEVLEAEMVERRQVEKQLEISDSALRQVSRRALMALEADRKAVAKELHDSIGASLAAIKFSLEDNLIQRRADALAADAALGKIITYLKETIKETKRISSALRPSTLDDLGLLPTIQWHCREMSKLYAGVEIRQHYEIQEADVPDEIGIVLFRVLQEAVNNATKHAAPSAIDVHLRKRSRELILEVIDDGSGFDPRDDRLTRDPMRGNGIKSMQERVALCGGNFSLRSRPGEGTRVQARLPLAWE